MDGIGLGKGASKNRRGGQGAKGRGRLGERQEIARERTAKNGKGLIGDRKKRTIRRIVERQKKRGRSRARARARTRE